MKKFENNKTVVKGFIINKSNGQATAFEATTAYVRSTEKAAKMIDVSAYGFKPEDVIVVVSECINEKATPKQYNTSKIYDLCESEFDNEETAKQYAANANDLICKAIPWYQISGQVWAVNDKGEYITDTVADETPINATKCDVRHILANSFETAYENEFTAIGVHGEEKTQITKYCVITAENLEKCVKVSEK